MRPALVCVTLMTILCGMIYTCIITGIAGIVFPEQAGGSIIAVTLKDGTRRAYGSALMAQEFTQERYLIGRPLGTTNLSPTGEKQKLLVQGRIDWWHAFQGNDKADIPMDLVTASGSGVDPYISPEAAEFQVARIARARGISENEVRGIIKNYSSGRFLSIFGESAVHVLKANLALDGLL